jgi:hypothetical protein
MSLPQLLFVILLVSGALHVAGAVSLMLVVDWLVRWEVLYWPVYAFGAYICFGWLIPLLGLNNNRRRSRLVDKTPASEKSRQPDKGKRLSRCRIRSTYT